MSDAQLPSRDDLLAANLTVELRTRAKAGDRDFGPVVYRFETDESMQTFGNAEGRVLASSKLR